MDPRPQPRGIVLPAAVAAQMREGQAQKIPMELAAFLAAEELLSQFRVYERSARVALLSVPRGSALDMKLRGRRAYVRSLRDKLMELYPLLLAEVAPIREASLERMLARAERLALEVLGEDEGEKKATKAEKGEKA